MGVLGELDLSTKTDGSRPICAYLLDGASSCSFIHVRWFEKNEQSYPDLDEDVYNSRLKDISVHWIYRLPLWNLYSLLAAAEFHLVDDLSNVLRQQIISFLRKCSNDLRGSEFVISSLCHSNHFLRTLETRPCPAALDRLLR